MLWNGMKIRIIESNRRAILSRLITFSIFNSYAQLIDHSMHLENSYLRQIKNILMSIPVMGTYIKQELDKKGTLNLLLHNIHFPVFVLVMIILCEHNPENCFFLSYE